MNPRPPFPSPLTGMHKKFEIRFNGLLCSQHNSLLDALRSRRLSGDLLYWAGTNDIVTNLVWLWEWERNNPTSYAHKAIRTARLLQR